MRNQNQTFVKKQSGFTLIELLVVVAIIALLSSVALIAFMSARQKGRDAKRVSDMVQMNTGLELYFATFKGYPSTTNGSPLSLVPSVASSLPKAPQPADGGCDAVSFSTFFSNPGLPATADGSNYYYYPSGTTYTGGDGTTLVYPDYNYYFCLGNQTGNLTPGPHILNPKGLR